jgi:DNA-binding response OmpR family regulator
MDVLIAKIKALLRRVYDYNDTTNHLISYGEIILDLERAVLSYQNNEVILTQNECQIMGLFMKEAEKTVSRTKIMKTLWRDEWFIDENTLTVNMTRLRGKLKEIGLEQCIHTVKGKGYRIEQ